MRSTTMHQDLQTKVVSLKRQQSYDVYIGRNPDYFKIPREKRQGDWGNPFSVDDRDPRPMVVKHKEAVEKYRKHMLERLTNEPELWERLVSVLGGKRLGCFCAPLPCHGEVLAEFADQGLTFRKKEEKAS